MAFAILAILPASICSAQTPADAPAEKASVNDIVKFTQAVLTAAQKNDCSETTDALNAISNELRERVAFVVANINNYEVSRETINIVQTNSREIALHATNCPALTDIYRSIALKAHILKTAPEPDTSVQPQ